MAYDCQSQQKADFAAALADFAEGVVGLGGGGRSGATHFQSALHLGDGGWRRGAKRLGAGRLLLGRAFGNAEGAAVGGQAVQAGAGDGGVVAAEGVTVVVAGPVVVVDVLQAALAGEGVGAVGAALAGGQVEDQGVSIGEQVDRQQVGVGLKKPALGRGKLVGGTRFWRSGGG